MGPSGQPNTQAPNYVGLQVQTAVNTLPISILWGTNRLAPNLIDYGDFASHNDNSQSGGKGGSDSSGSKTYTATVVMGICEGVVESINLIWANSFTAQSWPSFAANNEFTTFIGNQANGWGHFQGGRNLIYPDTCYVAVPNYKLGSSPSLPNHNMEVSGMLAGTGNTGHGETGAFPYGLDADMALVIFDFLTNPRYGVGFPVASIAGPTPLDFTSGPGQDQPTGRGMTTTAAPPQGSLFSPTYQNSATNTASLIGANDASFQVYVHALGLEMSPALTSQESASSILQRWLKLTNTAAVWSGTTLKFIPYGDEPVTGQGVTYTPDVTPIYDLDDDDFRSSDGKGGIKAEEDPLEITRTDLADAKNCVRVEIAQRSNNYNPNPIEAKDQNAIELYGLRTDSSVSAHEIADEGVGATVAQLILQRNIYIRNTYTFKLSWEYCLLEPMDLVTLTDASLGMVKAAVRITAIEEDEDGLLTVTAEEFPAGTATATLYPKQVTTGYGVDFNQAAAPVNQPVIFEPGAALLGNAPPQVWIGASGSSVDGGDDSDPYWGGCQVWLSADGSTYQQVGEITAPARQGVLASALPATPLGAAPAPGVGVLAAAGIDTTHTILVDLGLSGGVLGSGSQADALAGRTLCWVDGEILAYATATLTAPGSGQPASSNLYTLAYLVRGLYGTTVAAHAAGSLFLRLDQAVFEYDLPKPYIGASLFVKLPSFNAWGGGQQSLADATAYSLTPTGVGAYIAPPTGALLTSSARTAGDGTHLLSVVVSWNPSAGPLLAQYQVEWQVSGSAWSSVMVGPDVTDYVIQPAVENATYQAQVRAVSTFGNVSAWDVAAGSNSGALSTTVPAAPTGLTAQSDASQSIPLAWNANPETDIQGYRVYAAQQMQSGNAPAFAAAAKVATLDGLAYTIPNLGTGQTWTAWVTAYNVAGESLPSQPATATTSYDNGITQILAGAITDSLLAPDLLAQIAEIGPMLDGLAQLVGAITEQVRATATTANSALARQVTTVEAQFNSALAAVQTAVTAAATATSANASAITNVETYLGGSGFAAVQSAMAASSFAGGGLSALYTLKTEVAADGATPVIAGIGIGAAIVNGTAVSEVAIQASKFIVYDDTLGVATSPLLYTGGTLYVNGVYAGTIGANQITGGTITAGNITINPATAGQGLTVYRNVGGTETLVLDSVNGIGLGSVSQQYYASAGNVSALSSPAIQAIDPVNSKATIMVFIGFAYAPNISVSLHKIVNGTDMGALQSFSGDGFPFLVLPVQDTVGAGSVVYRANIGVSGGTGGTGAVNACYMTVQELAR